MENLKVSGVSSIPKSDQTQVQMDRYLAVRKFTENICAKLEIEDHTVQPVAEVSPPKWHLGHTTWFFEEMILSQFLPGYSKFNGHFSLLFNSYYKAVGEHWIQGERGNLSRPTVNQVLQYRKHVDEGMIKFLRNDLQGHSHESADIQTLIEIGLQHEQQHQELLFMDIKYILGVNPQPPTYVERTLVLRQKSFSLST